MDLATDGLIVRRLTEDRNRGQLYIDGEPLSSPVPLMDPRGALSPSGLLAVAARSANNDAYVTVVGSEQWRHLGRTGQTQCVGWDGSQFRVASIAPVTRDRLLEQSLDGLLLAETPIPGGTSQGVLDYESWAKRFVLTDDRFHHPVQVGQFQLIKAIYRHGWWAGQLVTNRLQLVQESGYPNWDAGPQPDRPCLAVLGTRLIVNAAEFYPPYPTTPRPENVPRIGRALWQGWFTKRPPPQTLPRNCDLRSNDTDPELLRRNDGAIIAAYVKGTPDGSLSSLSRAIADGKSRYRQPILAYFPRALQGGPFPVGCEWLGLEGYQPITETLSQTESRLISECKRFGGPVIIFGQCYTSNGLLTTELRALVAMYARVAKACANVIGIVGFTGYGRDTGWEYHPEVHPFWDALADGVTGQPPLPALRPEPLPPEVPSLPPPKPPEPTMTIGLRSHTGQAVRANNGGDNDGLILADREVIGPDETFTLHALPGNRVAIESRTGRYFSAQPDGSLLANRTLRTNTDPLIPAELKTAIGPWEEFTPEPSDGKLAFKSAHGTYICAEEGGGRELTCNRPAAHDWERFLVQQQSIPTPQPPLPIPGQRAGVPRGNGYQVVDDAGGWLALGTSLFWAPYGEVYEPDRIEQHLSWTESQQCDYVRVIATGLKKGALERSLDPSSTVWQSGIAGLADRAWRHRQRVQWTLFGATYAAPSASQRLRAVDAFCEALQGREHTCFSIEVANEAWSNGFPGDAGRDELLRLVDRIRTRLPNLVAPTCPHTGDDITKAAVEYYYKGSKATVIGEHYSRKIASPDGIWRHTKKPWRESMFSVDGCPKLRMNQEPMGPESSGDETNDPLVLATDAAVTWVAGVSSYLLHCGGGIYGVADPSRGRPADLWATDQIDRIWQGLRFVRGTLPVDLPNWKKHKSNASDAPFGFVDTPEEQIAFCYSATQGKQVVMPVVGVVRPTTFTLRSGTCQGQVLHPVTGEILDTFDKSFRVTPAVPSVLVIATKA